VLEIVFETHSTSEDNERGVATGWLPGRLSEYGKDQARALGERRRDDGLVAVYFSDLRRAVETAEIAFPRTDLPIYRDARLRECNYGELNGRPRAEIDAIRCSTSMTRSPAARAGARRSSACGTSSTTSPERATRSACS
jgi:broad specificity phosphatase PhoE